MSVAALSTSLLPGQAAFAFGGSALLFPYYFGLLYVLTNTSYIVPGQTPLAGISGGAITSAVGCSGYSAVDAFHHLVSAVEQHRRDIWVVRESLLLNFSRQMPADAFRKCSDVVHIAASQLNVSSASLSGSTSFVVRGYTSNEDFFRATAASSTLACAGYTPEEPSLAGPAFYPYRGMAFLDGAYANNMSTLCEAMGLQYGGKDTSCVSIYTYEPGVFRKYHAGNESSSSAAASSPGAPAPAASSPAAWRLPTDCAQLTQSGALPGFMDTFNPASGPWPSIFPGCDPRNPLPFTREEWQAMALDGTRAAPHMQTMFDLGAADGQLWVRNQTEAAVVSAQNNSSRSSSTSGGSGSGSGRGDSRRSRRLRF